MQVAAPQRAWEARFRGRRTGSAEGGRGEWEAADDAQGSARVTVSNGCRTRRRQPPGCWPNLGRRAGPENLHF